MTTSDPGGQTIYDVNDEEQYSIWPSHEEIPAFDALEGAQTEEHRGRLKKTVEPVGALNGDLPEI